MKVEILNKYKNNLHEELDYELFLSLFEQNQPLLSSVVLRPMDEKEAVVHYAQLEKLEKKFPLEKRDILLKCSANLPALNHLLNLIEKKQLEQFHLFELGNFLHNDTVLCSLEENFPLDAKARKTLDRFFQILELYTEKSFSTIRENEAIKEIKTALLQSEKNLKEEIVGYEQQIFENSGIKMTYPWPKEVVLSDEQATIIDNGGLLRLKKLHDIWLIDYRKSPRLLLLQNRKDKLHEQYETLMQEQMIKINGELAPFGSCFKKYFQKRVKRTYHYLLLAVKNEHNFCLPDFTTDRGCHLEKGYLFALKTKKQIKCIPLDLTLGRGPTVLYGSNMSGKTTLLKTLYFLLTLVQFGMPVPARKFTLHYPKQIALLLKSPGDVRKNTSSYGEELAFFAQPMVKGAYILADELFLSTDPTSGVILSDLLIRSMANADKLFFCTTHYSEILDIEDITLFKMEDPDPLLLQKSGGDLQSLHEFMPYRLIPITDSDHEKIRSNRTPLKTALLFDLPADMKEGIKKYLTETKF